MHDILINILICVIPAILASQGLWTYLLYKRQKKDESKDLRLQADLAILHDLVYRYCKKAILRECTTFDEFENITSLYKIYRKIGGNGTCERLYEEYCKLPKK